MTEDMDPGHEPTAWLLLFSTATGKPWLDRLLPGRFKHVSAAGWVSEAKVWIFYDVSWLRTSLKVLDADAGDARFAVRQRGHGVLKVWVEPEIRGAAMMRAGFWCVPAIKHLIGSRSGALRPDRLWRDLVAANAEIISYETASPDGNRPDRSGVGRLQSCEGREN